MIIQNELDSNYIKIYSDNGYITDIRNNKNYSEAVIKRKEIKYFIESEDPQD